MGSNLMRGKVIHQGHLNELAKFVVAINDCRQEQAIYKTLANYLPLLVKADRASICLLDEDREHLSIFALNGEQGLLFAGARLPLDNSVAGRAFLKKKTILSLHEDHATTADCKVLLDLGLKACINAPIFRQGKAVGTLNIAVSEAETYDQTAIEMLEAIASMTSTCLDRQLTLDRTSEAAGHFVINLERLHALAEITPQLAAATNEKEVFDIISRTFCSLLPLNRISYVAYDNQVESFSTQHTYVSGGVFRLNTSLDAAGTAMESIIKDKSPAFFKDLTQSPFTDHKFLAAAGLRCAWSIPVYSKTEIVGVLNLAATRVPDFHADILNLGSIMGNILGSARERVESHQMLKKLAYTDTLTGLPNRASFNEKIEQLIALGKEIPFTLYLIDFDNFKELNDRFGHPAGDLFLQHASDWLKNAIGESGFVARLGGDEFAILRKHVAGRPRADQAFLDLLQSNTVSMNLENHPVALKFCAGIVHCPEDASEKFDIIRNADLALYAAKSDPEKQIQHYTKPLSQAFHQRLNIIQEFNEALDNDRIICLYQPIVDLKSGKIAGVEALTRWQHREQGLLCPAEFHEVFSDPQTCIRLGNTVLDQVAETIKTWRSAAVEFGNVAINTEPASLTDDSFFTNLLRHIGNRKLRPDQIIIEITEHSLLQRNSTTVSSRLEALRDAGIHISLDDFGTGYSSITHLKTLPVSSIKLDNSYVGNILPEPRDAVIVQGLISMADNLGLDTVAEGIESREQWRELLNMGCRKGQGLYFSDAVAAGELANAIKKIKRLSVLESGQDQIVPATRASA